MAEIAKVSYTHDAMIDCIIANPSVTGAQLAAVFGFSSGWISQVVSSDSFKSRLAERKGELVDPGIAATTEQRLEAIMRQSMDVVQSKMVAGADGDFALKAVEVTTKALGFGARDRGAAVQASFVVVMPQPSASVADWSKQHDPAMQVEAVVVEIQGEERA